MSHLHSALRRSTLPLLLVVCLAALSFSYAFADEAHRPLAATDLLGSPDAAVNGKFAVGSAAVGTKALTVTGVIDFLGAGTVHNYFTQGGGNNMQINTNVDEANTVGDASRSQWKLVLGSNLDQFSIRRSPAGGTYNEDALFWIEGSTGRVGITTVDTGNGATIPFALQARLHVRTDTGNAIWGVTTATTGSVAGVTGMTASTMGSGVLGWAAATSGTAYGVFGQSDSSTGTSAGVYGIAAATAGGGYGVYGASAHSGGAGVAGISGATSGGLGVYGESAATGVHGHATGTGVTYGVYGTNTSTSTNAKAVFGSISNGIGVQGQSGSGIGVYGWATMSGPVTYGVYGQANSASGYGVYSDGDLFAEGDFTATGTKAALVETHDYGWRTLYAVESPQNWFEDFGRATLVSGEATVSIDPVFAQTVNLDDEYHVFLTPRGRCALYVASDSPTSFTVRALDGEACDISFDYRIIAPRLGYENLRLEPAQDP